MLSAALQAQRGGPKVPGLDNTGQFQLSSRILAMLSQSRLCTQPEVDLKFPLTLNNSAPLHRLGSCKGGGQI